MRSRMLPSLPALLAGGLLALVLAAPASSYKVYGPAWREDTVTYYNTIPAYDA